jgi:DNA-binding NtrC family response regulator
VVLTAYGTVGTAVQAMKQGAVDFLEKPVELSELFRLAASLVAPEPGDETLLELPGGPSIVGSHPRFRGVLRLLERVAATETTVLLTGESGTGKELFARAVHALSPRRQGPFVAVNCAAIPEALLENELFGHEKGAFTGAHRREEGRFTAARGGTLFLDEVAELSLGVQGKVLRVLEERAFERVGSAETLRADVRLVAATNRDLDEMVSSGALRSDLYFRLAVFPVHLPPLRERASDVPLLARHLLHSHAGRHGVKAPELTASGGDLLIAEEWPGNVRQLANLMERMVILHPGERLGPAELRPGLGEAPARERQEVMAALEEAGGDKRRAADILGVSLRTLQRRVQQHGLEGYPRYRQE